MNILALDTATENCSAALWAGERLYLREEVALQKHAELILNMADSLLKESRTERSALDAIAFDCGPGSFTGVRIATAAAQGLALGLNLPVIPVTSLEAMAWSAFQDPAPEFCISAVDARMGEVYLGIYRRSGFSPRPLCPPAVLKPEAALEMIGAKLPDGDAVTLAGTGIDVLKAHGLNKKSTPAVLYPSARAIVELGLYRIREGQTVSAAEALPVYLRNEVTWKKLSEQGKVHQGV